MLDVLINHSTWHSILNECVIQVHALCTHNPFNCSKKSPKVRKWNNQFRLKVQKNWLLKLEGFSDSQWGGATDNLRCTCFTIGNGFFFMVFMKEGFCYVINRRSRACSCNSCSKPNHSVEEITNCCSITTNIANHGEVGVSWKKHLNESGASWKNQALQHQTIICKRSATKSGSNTSLLQHRESTS